MSDETPELSDVELELLRRLVGTAVGPEPTQGQRSLAAALRIPPPLESIGTESSAHEAFKVTSRQLARMTGKSLTLLRAQGDQGSFPTEDCLALRPALMAILSEREAARAAERRRRRLEWLQLASSLDSTPLRIGAYQAHAERFLVKATELMADYFPWLDAELMVEGNRQRFSQARGVVREKFRSGLYDLMLVPKDSERKTLSYVYTYSFRVVGTAETLARLQDTHGVVNIHKLRGERLLVAPRETSSRQRVHALFLAVDTDIDDGSMELIEEGNPNSMRMRAETGQGLAIISDEYATIGGSKRDFPYLGVSRPGDKHQEIHQVEMGLLRQPWANKPRHKAFDFVIEELVTREKTDPRAAALD